LTRYQEQAALLDPHLQRLVASLSSVLRAAAFSAASGSPPDLAAVQRVSRLLQLLAALRGPKTVAKFFSHDVAELEPALALLQACEASRGAAGEDEDGGNAWEARIGCAACALPLIRRCRAAPHCSCGSPSWYLSPSTWPPSTPRQTQPRRSQPAGSRRW
jgi:hypothetical protein